MLPTKKELLYFTFTFCILLIFASCINKDTAKCNTPYLGQKPPGLTPEIFAPDIISGMYTLHGFPAFSADGKEIYWPIIPPKIMFMKCKDNVWTSPLEASFNESNCQAPCFSPDGQRIYYQVSRKDGYGSLDIWYVERVDTGWSNPQNIGQPVNTSKLESQPSFTKDGTLYFTGELKGVMLNRGIYRAQYVKGRFSTPELLGGRINTEYLEIYPFIARDESYLLFCSTRPSMQEQDRRIFISFPTKDGKWSEPVNLNKEINFNYQSAFPYVTPDGKYLFFLAKGNMYWMSSEVIERLRPEEN